MTFFDVLAEPGYGLVPKSRGERAASFSYKNKRWLRELPERTGKVLVSIPRQFEKAGIEELETTNLFDEAEFVASGGFESLVGLPAQPQELIQETKVGWRWEKLKNISMNIQYGISKSSSQNKVGPKLLRITDIQEVKVDWSKVPYSQCNGEEEETYLLADGDLVFTRTGATTGKSFLVESSDYALFASYLIRVQCDKTIANPNYLHSFFQSPNYWYLINQKSRGEHSQVLMLLCCQS